MNVRTPLARPDLRRATAWTLLWRAVPLAAGPIHVAILAATLGPAEQGLYFAAAALVRWQTWLELGLGTALQQRVSRQAGRADDPARLAGLLRVGLRTYGLLALAWLAIAPIGGGLWLATGADAAWGPWIALAVVAGVAMPLAGAVSFVEGLGRVVETYRFKTVQSVSTRAAHWAALGLGLGAWSLAVERVAALVHGLGWLLGRDGAPLREALRGEATPVRWRSEIWPLQRDLALSIAGSFVPFALLVPVTYAAAGPVEAGRLGLTIALVSAVHSGAYAIVVPHVPELSMAAARGEREAVRARWGRVSGWATAAYVLGVAGIVAVSVAAQGWPIAERFLGPSGLAAVAGALGLNLLRALLAVHTRAWQREVLWPVNVAEGVATVLVVPLAALAGADAVAVAWCALNAVALGLACDAWRRWQIHSVPAESA